MAYGIRSALYDQTLCTFASGCRLPGNVNSPDQFWQVIKTGTNVVSDVPPDRWCLKTFYDKDENKPGKMISRKGGFIEGIDQFDHAFFKISPREAASMDPQQRHLLEVTYEAFEDAGIDPWELEAECGVYVGIGMVDYTLLTTEPSLMEAYSLTGVTHSVAANRLSYIFNLRGPSLAVDTACASSMTALHLACSALWNKECSVALVGGCNCLLAPETSIGFSALGVLSPDGQCCPFSSSARGYVRSEGWGALILKPLDKAFNDEDHIYAVIRGSAIAASGHSTSLTKPSMTAQQQVMEKMYQRCNIPPSSIDYLEAHGTGTPVGDPVEAQAIGETFSSFRTAPLRIGSVKSNFGHSECAAGVTAAIKVALMLEKRALCPTINFESPNPQIDFNDLKLQVQTNYEVVDNGSYRRMGINSFGFAGALAHAVFEQAPKQVKRERHKCNWTFGGQDIGDHILVPLSAKCPTALRDLAQRWISLESTVDALSVVSWLATRRRHHESRLAVVANSGDNFRHLLVKYLVGESDESLVFQGVQGDKQKVCFVFPGQGQQWNGMGRKLFSTEKVFRDTVQRCDTIFVKMSGKSLIRDFGIFKSPEHENTEHSIDEIQICQPAILFFQIGLIHLWSHWGVRPALVVGHSLGEIAAAYACGGLTMEEAVSAIFHRSNEQRKLEGTGSMAALRKTLAEATQLCSEYQDVFVAAINGPCSLAISGTNKDIKRICEENPSFVKRLRVQCAFHTPHMDAIQSSFQSAMMDVVQTKRRFNDVLMYSTVTGARYEGPFSAEYWWKNIRQTVLFQRAVENILIEETPDIVLELGSSVTLLSYVRQMAKDAIPARHLITLGSCQRNKDDRVALLQSLGSLYVAGKSINWHNVTHHAARWIPMPTYPWQHQPHWKESESRKKRRLGKDDRTFKGHKGCLSLEAFPMFKDHVIQKQRILPGAGYVEYLLQMCFKENENPSLRNIHFVKALVWPTKEKVYGGTEYGVVSLEIVRDGNLVNVNFNEVGYCTAEIYHPIERIERHMDIKGKHLDFSKITGKDEFYQLLKKCGLEYGSAFQVVKKASFSDEEVFGHLEPVLDSTERIHTTILDGCFQLLLSTLLHNTFLYIPVEVQSFQMEVPSLPCEEPLIAYAKVVDYDGTLLTGDVILAGSDGRILANVVGLQAKRVSGDEPQYDITKCLYSTQWQPNESRINLCTIHSEFHPETLRLKYQKEVNAIDMDKHSTPNTEDIRAAYIWHALESVPKLRTDKLSTRYVQWLNEIVGDITRSIIPYKEIPIAKENIKRALPVMEEEINAIQVFGEGLPVFLENPNEEENATKTNECWYNCFLNSLTTRIYRSAGAVSIVQAIEEALSEKQVVRVLVIGDGMAKHSQCILGPLREMAMKHRLEYVFLTQTDSSLDHAKKLLREFPFVRYQKADINKSLKEQGFISQSFDLVLCLYTLHATTNVTDSLLQLRSLLSERGCLLIYEVTKRHSSPGLVWRFSDLHAVKPWTSKDELLDILTINGFDKLCSVSLPDDFSHYIVVGYKCDEAVILNTTLSIAEEAYNYVIIETERHPLTQTLVKCMRATGRVQIVSEVSKIHNNNRGCPLQGYLIVYIHSLVDGDVSHAVNLLQQTNKLSGVQGLWVLTFGASSNQCHNLEATCVLGLLRAAGNYIRKFPLFSLDLDPFNAPDKNAVHVAKMLRQPPPDRELAFAQNTCFVPRDLPISLPEAQSVQTNNWELGLSTADENRNYNLDDIEIFAVPNAQPQDNELKVRVKAAGLNFKDVMMAMGMLKKFEVGDGGVQLGLECCGVVAQTGSLVTDFQVGDEVIVFAPSCFASHVKCRPQNVIHKPRNLTWTESAGIGIVFTTAYYSLIDRAGLKEGETVLIHSACGGVGLAAIQIAQMKKARIICSAGTEEKRQYLKTKMGVEHVTDSRSQQFYSDVMNWTRGKGVDVVLNSLHGELMTKGIALLSHGGRFCEIGKRDILENSNLLMNLFLDNKSFLSCHVDILLRQQPQKFIKICNTAFQLLENGVLHPVKTTTHSISTFRETFRKMSRGEHIGKIVFDISVDRLPSCVQVRPDMFKPNATYIVTGAFGGIGLALCRWMSKKGAKHLVMTSHRGCHNAAGRRALEFLKKRGVNVYEFAGDLAEESFVKSVVEAVRENTTVPPIKGIFHLAGVIHEESLPTLRSDQINRMLGSKARSAHFLHRYTLDQSLDMFVLMSSSVALWGNSSQPCYCAANSGLDALARYRHNLGLPALSLQLGAVRGAGFLEHNIEIVKRLADKGSLTLHIDDVLGVLGKLLRVCDKPVICLTNQVRFNLSLFIAKICNTLVTEKRQLYILTSFLL